MGETYASIHQLHQSLPPFAPYVPATLLPYLAFVLLMATFVLGFYFSTLPKATIPAQEVGVASLASVLAGFGVVALFCSVGVNIFGEDVNGEDNTRTASQRPTVVQ